MTTLIPSSLVTTKKSSKLTKMTLTIYNQTKMKNPHKSEQFNKQG